MKAIVLEFYKLRRKRIWVMMALFLSAEMIWACLALTMSMSRNPGTAGWEAIIATVASMNGLFLPLMSAIVVSRICDMEHKGNTWKLLIATNMKPSHIYLAKYACANTMLLYYMVLQTGVLAVFGRWYGLTDPIPFALLGLHIGGSILATMAIVAVQQWVSMSVKNQAFALGLGMIGGFIGMTADLFPAAVRRLFIWSYYSGLSPVTYQYGDQTARYIIQPAGMGVLAAVVLIAGIGYVAGSVHVSRQEM